MKVFLFLFSIIISFSSFGGEIINRQSGEIIKTKLVSNIIEIDGSYAGVASKKLKLDKFSKEFISKVKATKHTEDLFYLTKAAVIDFGYDDIIDRDGSFSPSEYVLGLIIPFYNLPLIGATSLDIICLPVNLPIKLIKNGKANKDLRIMNKVIFHGQSIVVSDSRFNRIKNYLGLN